ncbi:nuclear matrix protein-like protein [Perilla frutescens var. hirtella]|nr:nuclear matrix protein-like protein [Perilla frutescens var. hirtella]
MFLNLSQLKDPESLKWCLVCLQCIVAVLIVFFPTDIVLYLCEKEHVEGGMIFQLLEDLAEMSTMRNCKDIFGYIESKQDILGKPELFAIGKLVMLRTCNQLLHRLSK